MMKAERWSAIRLLAVTCGLSLLGAACYQQRSTPVVNALPAASTLPAPELVHCDTPVVLIYGDEIGENPTSDANDLDQAVWSDGRIVWRTGSDMRRGRVDPSKIDRLLQRLHKEGVFGTGKVDYVNFGPDSSFDVIEVRTADRRLRLMSWHEGFEQDPKLVVTSHGVESLEGRNRDAVLASEPKEYQRFRRIWCEIRSEVMSWLPPGGEPFIGSIPIEYRD